MWGEDLLALNMKGGIPIIEAANMLRQLQDDLTDLQRHIPTKQLSDEQIFKLAEMFELKVSHALYAFARTLIREAQN